ncbi:MAG: XTP/dITP diphosphatase [Spirochaetes bacterium]|nr:XTP/dITP diphosphatase [Spirochaetota bacterium]
MKLVIATNNQNKIREIRDKFATLPEIEILTPADFPDPPGVVEDGSTFRENALKKARALAEYAGMASLADDSGLAVDALDGRPGVFSARYGGDTADDAARNRMILDEMRGIPEGRRSARFICAIAIALPGMDSLVAEGSCEGIIAEGMRGDGGFGYDPIFYLPEFGRTMAELSLEEKNRISHRARALDAARELLRGLP